MKLVSLTALLFTCAAVNAQVYSYVDKNGNTVYTDNPPEQQEARKLDIQVTQPAQPTQDEQHDQVASNDVKTVRLSPSNDDRQNIARDSLSTVEASITPSANDNITTDYLSIDIVKPTQEETFRNTNGQMTIEVKSQPQLAPNNLYRFIIDGNILHESTSAVYNAANLERGQHVLAIEIITADTKQTIMRSENRIFFIKQTTLAEKRRIRPCLIREYGVRPECPLKDKPKPEPRNLLLRTTDILGLTSPQTK